MSNNYCDTVFVDESNTVAWDLIQKVLRQPDRYGLVYLWGTSGIGKTHMVRYLEHEMRGTYPDMDVLYITAEQMKEQFLQAVVNDKDSFMEQYKHDLLIVDDLQCVVKQEANQRGFEKLFDMLYVQGKQVVIVSNRPPRAFATLNKHLRRHLKAARIREPGPEVRHAIVERECRRLGVELAEDVRRYLVGQATNPCKILSLVHRVGACHELEKLPIDVDRVHAYIKDLL